MIWEALQIAYNAHHDQLDKGGNAYFLHPVFVALQMDTEEEKITGILHDVIEDTDVTLEDLKRQGFSENVIAAVDAMTRREDETYMEFIKRLSVNEIARHVKIQDIRNNMDLTRIPEPTKKDWDRMEVYMQALTYLEEKESLADILTGITEDAE
ncbi:MAG: GTP pyrophosphokinase [Solobacterium sp.]|nr:GTP pyrophosphokinase [Solobacterium sp.]